MIWTALVTLALLSMLAGFWWALANDPDAERRRGLEGR